MEVEREGYPCREKCKYQRGGRCALEQVESLARVHGAVCCEHLLEDEETLNR